MEWWVGACHIYQVCEDLIPVLQWRLFMVGIEVRTLAASLQSGKLAVNQGYQYRLKYINEEQLEFVVLN